MTKVHTNDVKTRALCWFYVLPYGMVLSCLIEMKPDEYIYIYNKYKLTLPCRNHKTPKGNKNGPLFVCNLRCGSS